MKCGKVVILRATISFPRGLERHGFRQLQTKTFDVILYICSQFTARAVSQHTQKLIGLQGSVKGLLCPEPDFSAANFVGLDLKCRV